mgnify:CR=1 FL=1
MPFSSLWQSRLPFAAKANPEASLNSLGSLVDSTFLSAKSYSANFWAKAFAAEQFPTAFLMQGQDASQPFAARIEKPRLVVLVVGETARAEQFSLNGYTKQTNPELSKLPVFSFSDVSSCGTATAHSVPCMFSNMGREHYEEKIAKNSSNVLDILQYAAGFGICFALLGMFLTIFLDRMLAV